MDKNIILKDFLKLIKESEDYIRAKLFYNNEVVFSFDNEIVDSLGIISYEETDSPFMLGKPVLYVNEKFFNTKIYETINTEEIHIYLKTLSTNNIESDILFSPFGNGSHAKFINVSYDINIRDINVYTSDRLYLIGAKDSTIYYENMFLLNDTVFGYMTQYNTNVNIKNLFYFYMGGSSYSLEFEIKELLKWKNNKVSFKNLFIIIDLNDLDNLDDYNDVIAKYNGLYRFVFITSQDELDNINLNYFYNIPLYTDKHLQNNFLEILDIGYADKIV